MTKTRLISGHDVQVGTDLAYLGKAFRVERLEDREPHPTIGAARTAYDYRGRGMTIFLDQPTTIVA